MVLLNARGTESSGAARKQASPEAFDEDRPDSASLDLPAAFDSWELEERLRHVKRLLAPPAARESRPAAPKLEFRIDAAQASDPRSEARADAISGQPRIEEPYRGSWASLAAWSAIAIGLAALTCGGVLCGWSLARRRDELWAIGLPVLLGGQMMLVAGLLLQLRRIWRNSLIRQRSILLDPKGVAFDGPGRSPESSKTRQDAFEAPKARDPRGKAKRPQN
jgi:hypothetical protein